MHASLSLATTLLLSTARGSLQQTTTTTTETTKPCLPTLRYIKLQSATDFPVSVFEIIALDKRNASNIALPSVNPSATATQSSTFQTKNGGSFDASLAIDGDLTTFSHTKSSTGNHEWIQIDLGSSQAVRGITVMNRWCGDVSDSTGCLCRLSQANLTLLDDSGVGVVWHETLGDTCGVSEVKPMQGKNLARLQFCNTTNDATGHVATTSGGGKTSSTRVPTRLPTHVPTHVRTRLPTASPVVVPPTFSADIFSSTEGGSGEKSFPTNAPVQFSSSSTVETATGVAPSSESFPAADNEGTGTENDSLEGHAFSVGDKCEDDATFVSDKGITCVSFVYAENVRCRSPTGMHDKEFNALRYSDFCPKTCGLCSNNSQTNVAASTSGGEGSSKRIGAWIGFTLAISIPVLICLLRWMSRHTSRKSSAFPPSSSFRDSAEISEARGEYRDDAGVTKPRAEFTDDVSTVDERISECIGEKVVNTEFV
ncbi:hypothetical protein ACHAW6_006120 [Cyclotella cf. meneghiniana]